MELARHPRARPCPPLYVCLPKAHGGWIGTSCWTIIWRRYSVSAEQWQACPWDRARRSWVELLTPVEIAVEIERSADILAVDWRDVPERQRSIRAVFDWSWRRLSAADRQIFAQLAVFRGGFTAEAAEAVVGASPHALRRLVHHRSYASTHRPRSRRDMKCTSFCASLQKSISTNQATRAQWSGSAIVSFIWRMPPLASGDYCATNRPRLWLRSGLRSATFAAPGGGQHRTVNSARSPEAPEHYGSSSGWSARFLSGSNSWAP